MTQPNPIDITKLSLEQLDHLKQQHEEEIQILTDFIQQLRVAGNKYEEGEESLKQFTPERNGETILIPLTSSMYVPGKIGDADHVVVDIGTGYYLKKTIPEAKEFTKRKLEIVSEKMQQIQKVLHGKRQNYQSILLVMKHKIEEYEKQEMAASIKK